MTTSTNVATKMTEQDRKTRLVEDLSRVIATSAGVTVDELVPEGGRAYGNRYVRDARRELYARLWSCGLSLADIGRLVGRDHTTVMYGIRRALGEERYQREVEDRAEGRRMIPTRIAC